MDFEVIFYTDEKERSPVEELLTDLVNTKKALAVKARNGIAKLRNNVYHTEPLSKYLEPGLWELRIKAGTDILRIIYTFRKGRVIILLHGFIKKQQKAPKRELEVAKKRQKEMETMGVN